MIHVALFLQYATFNVQESAAQQLGLNEEDIMFKYSYRNTISLFAIVMIGTELHIVFNYTLNVSNSIVFYYPYNSNAKLTLPRQTGQVLKQSSCPDCHGNVTYVFFGRQEKSGPARRRLAD